MRVRSLSYSFVSGCPTQPFSFIHSLILVALAQVLDVRLDCATCVSATLRGLALVISACCVQWRIPNIYKSKNSLPCDIAHNVRYLLSWCLLPMNFD